MRVDVVVSVGVVGTQLDGGVVNVEVGEFGEEAEEIDDGFSEAMYQAVSGSWRH